MFEFIARKPNSIFFIKWLVTDLPTAYVMGFNMMLQYIIFSMFVDFISSTP